MINEYVIENQNTFYKPLEKKKKLQLFCEVVMKIIGYIEKANEKVKSWVLMCTYKNEHLVVETKTIILDFDVFTASPLVFEKRLTSAVGYSVSVGSGVQSKDIKDYKFFLQSQYTEPIPYTLIEKVGFIGKGTWFLNEKTDLVKAGFEKSDEKFILGDQNKFKHLCLDVDSSLFKKENCIEINKKIYELLEGFGTNQWNAEFCFAFILSRLLLAGSPASLDSGESNVLLLHSGSEVRNVGKTLLQKHITFGQGASLQHKLIVSGGSGSSSGTSSRSLQEICNSSSMVLCVNETKNGDSQSEMLIHLHERFFQGTKTGGLECSDCSGIVLSSNYKEPQRLQGRVLSLEFVKGDYDRQKLDELYEATNRHKGFLTSWVIHHCSTWLDSFKEEERKISEKLKQQLKCCEDDRWHDAVALVLFTKFIFCSSIGINFSLVDEVRKLKQNYERTERSFWLTLETKLREFVNNCDREKLLSWLKPNASIGIKDKIPAFCITQAKFDEMLPKSSDELKRELGSLSEQAYNQSIKFNDKNDKDDAHEENGNDNDPQTTQIKSNSIRSHKIPKHRVSEDLVNWLDKVRENPNEYLSHEIPRREIITDDEIDLESFQYDMNQTLQVTHQNPTPLENIEEQYRCLPPVVIENSKLKSPKSKIEYLKGSKETWDSIVSKKRKLNLQLDVQKSWDCTPSIKVPVNPMDVAKKAGDCSTVSMNVGGESTKTTEKKKRKTGSVNQMVGFPDGVFGAKGMSPITSTPLDENYGTKHKRQTDYPLRKRNGDHSKNLNSQQKRFCPCMNKDKPLQPSISCDKCGSPYHLECTGLVAVPDNTQTWLCKECRK
ncbi:uncharacterized protein [Clytia hemisphaerica]